MQDAPIMDRIISDRHHLCDPKFWLQIFSDKILEYHIQYISLRLIDYTAVIVKSFAAIDVNRVFE